MSPTRQNSYNALSEEIDLTGSFRERKILEIYIERIQKKAARLASPVNIMEVCGSHTHAVLKYSLDQALKGAVHFLHGPGCPVCVLPKERIDQAIALASLENTILVTLGDLAHLPGSNSSLARLRALGNDIRFAYSPLAALEIAAQNPNKNVIFFAIGFETTTPATAYLVQTALKQKTKNLFFHINHVLIDPAMQALVNDPSHEIGAFLAPPHVSAITGTSIYEPFAREYSLPVVVGGFEPADILEACEMILDQTLARKSEVEIQYTRAVDHEGNSVAQKMVDDVFQRRLDFRWRGLGSIPRSALGLKADFLHLDAETVFSQSLPGEEIQDDPRCLCPEILKGKKEPPQCPCFQKECTPANPIGACMVSTEGACAAWNKYSYQNKP